ncbi:hypothetical protein Tco_0291800 [Tanacetum coccineum]
MEQIPSLCDMVGQIMQKKEEEKRIAEEQAAKDRYWKIPICYDDDDDYTIAITPVLPTKSLCVMCLFVTILPLLKLSKNILRLSSIPTMILLRVMTILMRTSIMSMHHLPMLRSSLDYVEDCVIPEVGRIDTDILLTIKDDILREKLLNVNLLIANIEALKDNPTPSFDVMTKSSSTSLNLFLEETNTFDNSLPESETFCFDLEENSSGSTTTRSDYSLSDYESFYSNDDHIEEISSGSTTTHHDFSLSQYVSFIFDLSINPFPPADRSDFYHEEFADELAYIISPSEYDHFCFKIEPELGNLTMDVVNEIFPTREPRVHVYNVLTTIPPFTWIWISYF